MQVQADLEEFDRRGVRLVAVGQGTGDEAAHYCGKLGASFPCLGDPDRSAYQGLALRRGTWWSVVGKALLTQPAETIRRIRDADLEAARLAATDVLQLGGVAIVEQGGTMRFLHVAESPDDIPPNAEIFSALDQLAA